jgi:hypothetical protein
MLLWLRQLRDYVNGRKWTGNNWNFIDIIEYIWQKNWKTGPRSNNYIWPASATARTRCSDYRYGAAKEEPDYYQTLTRKSVATARSQLKTIGEAKQKKDRPVFADIENILLEYGISAAACHGRKLKVLIAVNFLSVLIPFLSVSNTAYSLSHIQDDVLKIQ